MAGLKFQDLLQEGLIEALDSSSLDAWERTRRFLEPLLRLGEIGCLQVYRKHQGDLTLLGEVGVREQKLRFSVFDAGAVTSLGGEIVDILDTSARPVGLLALVPKAKRPLPANWAPQIARVVGRLLSGRRTSPPQEERIERSLRGVLEQLVSSARPVDVLRPLLLEMIAQVNSNGGGLFVYDSGSQTLRMVELVSYRRSSTDLMQPEFDSFTQAVAADITPYWARLLEERAPVVLDANSPADEIYFWPGTRAWHLAQNEPLAVGFPLLLGKRPLGFIGLTYSSAADVGPPMLEVAAPFVQEATLAVALIELGEKAREQLRRSQSEDFARMNLTIQQGLAAVEDELQQHKVVGGLLKVVSDHLGSHSSALWLYDSKKDRYEVTTAWLKGRIITDADEIADSWPAERDLLWRDHIRERRPVAYRVEELEPESERLFFRKRGIQAILGIPLISGQHIVGSFTMRFPEARNFSCADLQLVQMLSHQATLAILLTRTIERAEQLAVTAERSRLAGELHDTIAQDLSAVLALSRSAQGFLGKAQPDHARALEHLQKVERLARKGVLETRRSLQDLHPLPLAQRDLAEALQQLASSFGRCHFSIRGQKYPIPTDVERELYRISQEGVQNAIRHSGAARLVLKLNYSRKSLRISLQDDGSGDWNQADQTGHGLRLIEERAARVGAVVLYQKTLGKGTKMSVVWELPAPLLTRAAGKI